MIAIYKNELYHHGIEGQKWGVRNGPPYPLVRGIKNLKSRLFQKEDGSLTPIGRAEYIRLYNKQRADRIKLARFKSILQENKNYNKRVNTDLENPRHELIRAAYDRYSGKIDWDAYLSQENLRYLRAEEFAKYLAGSDVSEADMRSIVEQYRYEVTRDLDSVHYFAANELLNGRKIYPRVL